ITAAGLTLRSRMRIRFFKLTGTPAETASTQSRTGTAQMMTRSTATARTRRAGDNSTSPSIGYTLCRKETYATLPLGPNHVPIPFGANQPNRGAGGNPCPFRDHVQALIAELSYAGRSEVGHGHARGADEIGACRGGHPATLLRCRREHEKTRSFQTSITGERP